MVSSGGAQTRKEFVDWLHNELMPEGQRQYITFHPFKKVKQLKDQSVSEFITYFKTLESDLNDFSEPQRILFLIFNFFFARWNGYICLPN